MKKTKKALLTVLSSVFVVSASLGVASCSDGKKIAVTPVSITKLEPEFAYIVGDSVHMFDHFEYVEGLTYTFTVTYEDEDAETVEGTAFYLAKEGNYTITCTATNGKDTKTDTVTIFVGNEKAFMQFKKREAEVDWMRSMWDVDILALADPITIVDCEYDVYIESVVIYDAADGSGRTVMIEDGVKIEDEAGTFYNGADRFTFVYECDYLFTVVCETSGGKVSNQFTIKAKENFDNLELLSSYSVNYDKTSYTATWDAVDGASSYYVKVDRRQKTITETTIDIKDMIISEFQYFDLHVVPLNAAGERMGKLVYEDVVIAPEGSDGLVKGVGATVNTQTKEVVLAGKQAATAGYNTGIRYVQNSYIAFGYKYGIGTYIDFEFTGNNLPQLCFFANEINSNMTCDTFDDHLTKPNEGYLLMNGLAVGSATNIKGGDALICVGPYRFGCDKKGEDNKTYIHGKKKTNHPHINYISVAVDSKAFTASANSLFTYNGLKEAGEDQKYKYTVGTFVSGGKLAFDLILRDGETGGVLETARFVTDSNASDIKPGHIIAYAGVKGDGVDTKFTYSLPYESEPAPEDGVTRPDKTDPYSVILSGHSAYSAGWSSGVAAMTNSHIGIKGNYGVGTYIDFIFTGNNLPQVALFANTIDGNMTAGVDLKTSAAASAYTGYLLMNGLHSANPGASVFAKTSKVIGENRLICVGPNKVGNSNYIYVSEQSTGKNVSVDTLFTQQKLREDTSGRTYKYTVGSKIDHGFVKIVVFLYDNATNELIAEGGYNTGKTKEEVEALGGNIIIYGCVKGENNDTVFKYTDPYEGDMGAESAFVMSAGATIIGENEVTLAAGNTGTGSRNGVFKGAGYGSSISPYKNNYIAWDEEYGVGTKVEFTFTGNNMPQVMLFANEINDSLGCGYQNYGYLDSMGYLIANGFVACKAGVKTAWYANCLRCFGPKRISVTLTEAMTTNFTFESGKEYTALDDAITYKYVVWSEVNGSGTVDIRVQLINTSDDSVVVDGTYATNKTQNEVQANGGKIIAYAGVKGEVGVEVGTETTAPTAAGISTTFKYSEPVKGEEGAEISLIMSEGASVVGENEVTLAAGNTGTGSRNGVFKGAGYGSNISPYKNNYIAWDGNYGVGTCVEFTFTGNNMPQVMLFANEINDSVGCGYQTYGYLDSKGYLIANGFVACKAGVKTAWYANCLRCFGPKRISVTLTEAMTTNFTFESGKEYTALDDAITYKYVVWSEVNGSGTVDIRVQLINTSDDSVVVDGTYATNKTQDEVQAYGGKIIAYAGVKGEVGVEVGTETTHQIVEGVSTTFKYSTPYTKQAQ